MTTPLLRLGSAWYPELWDDAVIAADLRLMQKLGFNAVRIGDFAWSHFEPEDGRFDTAWMERVMDLAAQYGLGVIMCTPTAGPPAWLLHAHPDIGWVERAGYRHGIGGRQAADYSHPVFQHYSRRITEVVAKAFGRHPALIGWQTDNELAGHQKVSLSESALSGWHNWLRRRYGTVAQLNSCWGSDVWSNRYNSFEQVPGPHPLPTYCHNHSLLTEYRRFMIDVALEFQRQQVAIIRSHSHAPITHNSEDSIDEWDLTRDLDFAGHDCYTNHMAMPSVVYRMDCFRALKPGRRFWVMETEAEGAMVDGDAPPGRTTTTAMLAYASGAEGVSYWPWRSNRAGAEITSHDGIVHPCGVPTTAWGPAQRTSELRGRLDVLLREFSPAPAQVAFVRSERNGHCNYIERIAGLEPNFNFRARLEAHYQDLRALGAWRDVIYDQAEVSAYRLVLTPYLPYATPEFLARMQAHLAGGGIWVVGPYSGYLTGHHTNPTNGLLGDLGELLSLDVRAWTGVRNQSVNLADGVVTTALMRAHAFAPAPGDELLGTYAGGPLGGLAWGLRRQVGPGTVYVLGSEITDDARRLVHHSILQREGIAMHALSGNVLRIPQVAADGRRAWALINADPILRTVALPQTGRNLLDGNAVGSSLDMPGYSSAFIEFNQSVEG